MNHITIFISITTFYGLAIGELRGQLHHIILGALCKTGLSWSAFHLFRCRKAENGNKNSAAFTAIRQAHTKRVKDHLDVLLPLVSDLFLFPCQSNHPTQSRQV